METIKMPLTGISDIDQLIETQQRRIETLKRTIEALEAISDIKGQRIEILKDHIKQLQNERE